ncbi:MAG: cupin domain-containing protein [Nitrospinae bacterium]|nr:cupin domain-containing protein [Nitrospinota bacterium]
MPIIEHSIQPVSESGEYTSVRPLVTEAGGAVSLTVKEVVMKPGATGRLHTHPTDIAITLLEGSIQMIVGDEIRTVRSGYTLLAPPGVPHKLVNNTWVAARMLVICPTGRLETHFLE